MVNERDDVNGESQVQEISLPPTKPDYMPTEIVNHGDAVAIEAAQEEQQEHGVQRQYSLADFELIRVIGRGSYAKVLMVELKRTRRIYAMKVIKKSLVTEDETLIGCKRKNMSLKRLRIIRFWLAYTHASKLILDYFLSLNLYAVAILCFTCSVSEDYRKNMHVFMRLKLV